MALEDYQVEIDLDTLYRVKAMGGTEQLEPSIWGLGTYSMYHSAAEPTSDPLTDEMSLNTDETDIAGQKTFLSVPCYIYVTGAATSVVLTGIEAEEVA